ncbi:hypothetical protein V1L54_19470 [Streptomyces sp. TRM 70361]|uniref:hypothetical protein n=1 Tax=Streptomyces sp. TRM 70361 TaxID=3116553 RepID=UPI002E7BA216|nr:hypothetical protein [Streptomyces sp. TRM 70361]MEE1941562.1 hypothetical protein [Streptomyces sp. TRM 70361]
MTDRGRPEWATARLKAAAAEHQPDRDRMWSRVAGRARDAAGRGGRAEAYSPEGPGGRARPPGGPLRVAGAAVGLVAALAAGALAAGWVAGDGGAPWTVRAPAGAAPDTDGVSSAGPSGVTGAAGPRGGGLSARGVLGPGSNAHWAQNDIVLRSTGPLTSLTVELRVAPAGEVRHTGQWCSLPADDFRVAAREEGGALVYRWELREGREVPPGEYRFAGQYHHSEGRRNVERDGYTISGVGPRGAVTVRGGFHREDRENAGDSVTE